MTSLTAVRGQERAAAVLGRALSSGKLAHAYLFEGIGGCGKRTTALALVQSLFCGSTEPCGVCPSCRKVISLQHPDLHLIEPDGLVIKIDQVRELQRSLALRPFEAPRKACIIDRADAMNPAAANALLKTLEEPPGNALLILLTEQPDAVLPTIRSRCQTLRFAPLPQEVIEALLTKEGTDAETARVAASMAGGSIARALEIQGEDAIQERSEILDTLFSLSLTEISPLFATAERLGKDKEKALELLETLTSFLRDLLILAAGGGEIVNSRLHSLLERELGYRNRAGIISALESTTRVRQALMRNVNPRLALEILFMRLAEHTMR